MQHHRLSYWKSIVVVGTIAIASGLGFILWVIEGWGFAGAIILCALCALSSFVAWGGWICLVRDSHARESAKGYSNTRATSS